MFSFASANNEERRHLSPPQPVVPPVAPQPKDAYAPPPDRFGEPLKWLPVAYVAGMLIYLYSVYMYFHILPNLQMGALTNDDEIVDESRRSTASFECAVFHVLYLLLLACYFQSILQHPGKIPDADPQWDYQPIKPTFDLGEVFKESKKSGERRHCKWCGKYKPDRCHHCRVCRICILKMDHHCPWIYNCVGFANYKSFMLLLFYCSLSANWMVFTMPSTVKTVLTNRHSPMLTMFVVLFGETLAGFMAMLTTLFLSFHIWLCAKAMTTIEFCEKSLPKKGEPKSSRAVSRYDLGTYHKITQTLGDNPLFWLVPISGPSGDGITWETNKVNKDAESGAGRAEA